MNKITENLLNNHKVIFEAAEAIVEKMNDKENKPVDQLAAEVADAVGQDVKNVSTLVDLFIRNCGVGYVSRGKKGGFVKGIKVVKPGKSE